MKIDQAYLNTWADSLFLQSRMLMYVASASCRANAPIDVITILQNARRVNNQMLHLLMSVGATNPLQNYLAQSTPFDAWQIYEKAGSNLLNLGPVPLSLLTSAANKAFLEALRSAQRAGDLVDQERGAWAEDWGDILGNFVSVVEAEITRSEERRDEVGV